MTLGTGTVERADAQTSCIANDETSLAGCITDYNAASAGTTFTITMTDFIRMESALPDINNTATPPAVLVFDGGGHRLSGGYSDICLACDHIDWEVLAMEAGDLRLSNVHIEGSAPNRGGLRVGGGSVAIVGSSFRNNGFGLVVGGDMAELRESTIAENRDAGIVLFGGQLRVERSTIAANKGVGISWFFGDKITIKGSLIARNDGAECAGTGFTAAADLGGNVIEDHTCGAPATAGLTDWRPFVSFSGCSTSPCTAAIWQLPEPAIDANTACGPGLVDQWGVARTAGKCDAGSSEYGDCSNDVTATERNALRVATLCYSRLAAGETMNVAIEADMVIGPLYLSNSATPAPQFIIDGGGHTLDFDGGIVYAFSLDRGHFRVSNLDIFDAGIYVERGSAFIENSTISEALAGIQSRSAELSVVRNSTLSDNNHGIYVRDGGAVNAERSTIVGNREEGVKILDTGAVAMQGSLVAGNDGSTQCSGAGLLDLGGNAFEDASCGGPATDGLAGSYAGLFDNGCTTAPCTKTVALIPGSPAIDANTSCGPGLFDQRGTPRTPGACDAGAFELLTAPALCNGLTVTINIQLGTSGIGTSGDDVILGTAGDDFIDALDGNDTVCAGGGDDEVLGGDGDDTLFGEGGNDLMRGGPGNDTLEGGDGRDRILGGINDDIMRGGPGNDYLGGFGGNDMIFGGAGNETIFGGFGRDTIEGGPGNDNIRGLIGDDTIRGDEGDDELYGDRGNDRIDGGPGNDTIAGGNANDILNGNGGDDTISGGKADDTLSGGPDTDVCTGNLETTADTADSTCEQIFGVP